MTKRTMRNIISFFAVALMCAPIALAQSPTAPDIPAITSSNSWQVAQSAGASMRKLFVVTLDQPNRRQTCRILSFTVDKLVCSSMGGPRTYLPQQVLALILPGDHGLKIRLLLGLNSGLAAGIWGTVALAAICPACAVATGIASLCVFLAAGAILIGDEQPDRLLYLTAGQHLTGKLRFVEP